MDHKSRLARELQKLKALTGSDQLTHVRAKGFVMPPDLLHPCVCGGTPVIGLDIYGKNDELIVRCPSCDRRVRDTGTFSLVRKQWNAHLYSHDSEMVAHPMSLMDDEGFLTLMEEIFQPISA